MVHSRIARALAEPEAALDRVLLGHVTPATLAGYRRYLCDVYALVEPVERLLIVSGGLQLSFIERRIKSGLIATDLLGLGLTTDEYPLLARRFPLERFASVPEALGWLYVAERLTTVHREVRDRITGLTKRPQQYLSSFNSTHWTELLAGVAQLPETQRAQAIATMRTATDSFRAWLEPPALAWASSHVSGG
jgi:heme oxygenase